jgi:hypothetical protein
MTSIIYYFDLVMLVVVMVVLTEYVEESVKAYKLKKRLSSKTATFEVPTSGWYQISYKLEGIDSLKEVELEVDGQIVKSGEIVKLQDTSPEPIVKDKITVKPQKKKVRKAVPKRPSKKKKNARRTK